MSSIRSSLSPKRVRSSMLRSKNSSTHLVVISRRLIKVSTSTTQPSMTSRLRLMMSKLSSPNSRRPTGKKTTIRPSMISVRLMKLKLSVSLYKASRSPKRVRNSKKSSKIFTLPFKSTSRLAISQLSGRKICTSSESHLNNQWKNENILFTST